MRCDRQRWWWEKIGRCCCGMWYIVQEVSLFRVGSHFYIGGGREVNSCSCSFFVVLRLLPTPLIPNHSENNNNNNNNNRSKHLQYQYYQRTSSTPCRMQDEGDARCAYSDHLSV